MKLRDIVGLCPEEAIWKMMAYVSEFLIKDKHAHMLGPDNITIDGDMFLVGADKETPKEFLPPEQEAKESPGTPQMVWTLGAVAYYAASGHVVFGGHGGSYQKEHPHVPLPKLPKAMGALTPVVQQCLRSDPSERIGLEELHGLALAGLKACSLRQREKSDVLDNGRPGEKTASEEKWPEEMTE